MGRRRVAVAVGAVALVAIGAVLAALLLRDGGGIETVSPIGLTPTALPFASPPPPPTEPAPLRGNSSQQPLWDIRLNAASARRFDVDPLEVRLITLQRTVFDGCLGIRNHGEACNAIALAGYVAVFEVGGKQATYHVADNHWVGPLDGVKAQVDDGIHLDVERDVDLNGILADYARRELALRLHLELDAVVTIHIIPTTFFNRCLGYTTAVPGTNDPCDTDSGERIPGAFVGLNAAGKQYDYNVSTRGIVWLDFSRGTGTQQPSMNVGEVQQLLREDLARRRGVKPEAVTVVSYRPVSWRDSCLGASAPDQICDATPVRGFLARLQANGEDEEYHGAGMDFIDAWAGGLNLTQPVFAP